MDKNEKKLAELHSLRAWCVTVIDYVINIDRSSAALLSQFKAVVNSSFDRKNLKGLKTIKKDLNEIIGDLSPAQKGELSKLLELDSNESLENISEKARAIIDTGNIDNDDDYRFLNSYIDYLLENNITEEVESINKILLQYIETLK